MSAASQTVQMLFIETRSISRRANAAAGELTYLFRECMRRWDYMSQH